MTTAIADRFAEGMSLARQADYDRAHRLFTECVIADPANYDFVDGLLLNLVRKMRLNGTPSEPDEALRSAMLDALEHQDWKEVLRLGPQSLGFNPWHKPTLLALLRACEELGYEDAELRYLQMAFEAGPSDMDINRHCGRSLARMKKFDEAITTWQRVAELAPGDSEAARMVASLSIEKSRLKGEKARPPMQAEVEVIEEKPQPWSKPETQPTTSPSASSPAKPQTPDRDTGEIDLSTPSTEQAIPIVVAAAKNKNQPADFELTAVQKLESAIRDYPSNPDFYAELVPLYLELGRDYDAERLLAKGKVVTDDGRIRQLWEDVVMLRMSRKITLAQQLAAKDADEEAKTHLETLCRDRDKFETEVFVSRSKREPKNAAIRYQLGLRFRQAGKIREALQTFAEALHDPQQKPLAALEMGRTYEDLREFPEALKHYRLAAESATFPEQLEARKQSLYRAGGLARRIKMQQLAKRYLTELVNLDPQYKEAAAWLKELGR
ncbi:MAG: tetratricopeptide repeat protein [Pirellulaceae bacterium]